PPASRLPRGRAERRRERAATEGPDPAAEPGRGPGRGARRVAGCGLRERVRRADPAGADRGRAARRAGEGVRLPQVRGGRGGVRGGPRRPRASGGAARRVLDHHSDRADEGRMNQIALFLPNWGGAVVMATPAVRAVRERFPAVERVAVCKPYVADVLAGSPWFREVILFDKRGPREQRLWSAAWKLRRNRPDAAVLFPNSFRTA